jgi:glycosyltransferase involved in cell wall biosynthesis
MRNAIYYGLSGPPTAGGHHVNVHHVASLRRMGLRAFLLYWPSGSAIERFEARAPVMLYSSKMRLEPEDIVVLPEGWRKPLRHFATLPCRKVLHCQNPHYVFAGVDAVSDYLALGIERAIVCSDYTARYLSRLGFTQPIHTVRPAVDRAFFELSGSQTRSLQIAFMPRKLPIEGRFVQGLFKARFPEFSQVPWVPISGVSLDNCARLLSQSAVFAAFSHLEGLGLPPLEAMACGCAVAGFHGGGGLEYATPANGFWAETGDLEGCAISIAKALRAVTDEVRMEALRDEMNKTVDQYSESSFLSSFSAAWHSILGGRLDRFLLGTD